MTLEKILKATAVVAAGGIIALVIVHVGSMKVHAKEEPSEKELVEIGLHIAPDFIDMKGKDPDLVGLGSFIVGGQADCNGCHSSDPSMNFRPQTIRTCARVTTIRSSTIRRTT